MLRPGMIDTKTMDNETISQLIQAQLESERFIRRRDEMEEKAKPGLKLSEKAFFNTKIFNKETPKKEFLKNILPLEFRIYTK